MHWKATTFLICTYGVVKEFRPATPFLTPFLVSHYKNLTLEEVYGQIYPFWTYSYLVALIPVFFLTDILRYKPVIVLEACCLCGTWAFLVWGQGVWEMQLMQIIFGLSSASEIAYYSYMYAIVDEKHYKMVTSYIRSAAMVGKLFAFTLGQILVSTGSGSYLLLNQISFGSCSAVVLIALFLPRVPARRVERQTRITMITAEEVPHGANDVEPTRAEIERTKLDHGLKVYLINTLKGFIVYKKNYFVLKWSIWWALASCGMYQVYNYMQTLWIAMQPDPEKVDNGIAECANTLSSAILSFVIQYLSINWLRYGELTLSLSSLIISAVLAVLSQINKIIVAYIGYVLCTAIYNMLITAASANIASELTASNYGLVFGWNTFVAVLLQSILTFAVADSHGFNLAIRAQFIVYSVYFGCVGMLFIIFMITSRYIWPKIQRYRQESNSNA
ncbi:hypothetical protein WR25_12553 [Diploscapter pachys]|uniref:Major facilitator superfamily (MFS) profile domain-containing protein n=1 Tax=Diploscapter pachys TaxID=2018661 RepID=A0A2A2JRF2_9BILA|nr:hypothetical protein WR25_12553 [Diploscapter pachys]